MNINKIIKMKDNKYKIFIDDDVIITYDNVILDNDLLYKKSIDNKLYNKIVNDTKYYEVYNKVVKYIMKRRRSEKEIRIYLDKFDIDSNSIIDKLKSIGLINDVEFAKAYINDKLYLGKVGINKIKKDLINENISTYVIDDIVSNIDSDILNNKLESLIIKKIRSNNKYSNYYLKQKILNDMINMGYNKEDILNIIDDNISDDNEVLKKEFSRVYNSLSRKYSGYELESKVRIKLSSKGFSIDEINSLLQEKTED